jgi:hypothetical protein
MPFLEQHVGHMVVGWIHEEALNPPDLTIESMNALTALHVYLTQRDNVLDHDRPAVSQAHANSHTGGGTPDPHAADATVALDRLSLTVAALVIGALHQVGFLRGIELVEIRDGAAQPDMAGRIFDQVNGNKPT